MLLWINGPFGGGKTTIGHELQRRLPGSVVCDPEHVGFGLHRMLPPASRRDFQDIPAWRQAVYEGLDLALTEHHGDIVAPMTLVEPLYFQEIIGRLRNRGHDVRHFALLAERDTVVRRLRQRRLGHALVALARTGPRPEESFALSRLDECLDRLGRPEYATQLWTDHLTVAQVADLVADSAGLTLLPNTEGPVRSGLRRVWTGARHIRFT